jgi:hypothetical protein
MQFDHREPAHKFGKVGKFAMSGDSEGFTTKLRNVIWFARIAMPFELRSVDSLPIS